MKKTYIIILGILGFFIAVTGLTYAFFFVTNNNTAMNTDVTAALLGEVDFVHGPSVVVPYNGIYPGWIGVQEFSIDKPSGMTEGLGAFEVVMETTIDAAYQDWLSIEVYKTTDMGNTITRVEGSITSDPDNANQVYVTDSLTTNGFTIPGDSIKTQLINSTSGTVSLDKQNFDLSTFEDTKYYVVYRYANANESQNSAMNKTFNTVIKVNAIKRFENVYKDPVIAGGDPVIPESEDSSIYKMLPVIISDTGVVSVADTSKEWYNYDNKEWANAVIADVTFLETTPGTVVPMDNIEQMYVWIPRYQYDPASIESAVHAIDVTFVDVTQRAHPAFTFGTDELSGMWVGKFEMGFNDGESSSTNNVEYVIKPNVNSVNKSNVNVMYNKINNAMEIYSFYATTDVHMMKNTEWGAVAYLSQSKYGVCNSDGTCSAKIESNNYYNSSTYDIVTGCGGVDTAQKVSLSGIEICPEENRWTTVNGIGASTTKNITGIYDMAGGRFEYVMGNMQDSSGNFYSNSSGFATAPESKYYDSYVNGSYYVDYTRGLPGDATVELNPSAGKTWNSDFAYFVRTNYYWFARGGCSSYGSTAGIWNFRGENGRGFMDHSARSVISFVQ